MSIDLYDGQHTLPDVSAEERARWEQVCWWKRKQMSSKQMRKCIRHGEVGWVKKVAVLGVCPDTPFDMIKEVLELRKAFGDSEFRKRCSRTQFYRKSKAWERIDGLVRVLKSISEDGYVRAKGINTNFPWMLVDSGLLLRLDGLRRAAVMRFLGYNSVEVVEATAEEFVKIEASL